MNPTQYWVVSVSFSAELLDRYHTRRNLTIVHGDAHIWNCFLPREGHGNGMRLFRLG